MAVDNTTILHDIWLKGTNDYQQRIPDATQSTIDSTISALFDPMNRQYYNQFLDALIMRIGDSFVHQQSYQNKLKVFKKNNMPYGNTIQEIIPKWIRAHSYQDDAEDVFKLTRPDVATWYHSQNRRDRYDISVIDTELRTAFTDSMGLNRLVSAILNVPMNSDEYDEYLIMKQLIAVYENKWGFYKQHVSSVPIDKDSGSEFLRLVQMYAGKLSFPTTRYNSKVIDDVPVFAKSDELVLLTTPEVLASLNVDTLGNIFHVEKAEIPYRTIMIDEFPLKEGAVGLLTTMDFFMCRDTEYQTTSEYNPKTLATNYWLHHWGIYSISPFVPAILFTTDPGSETLTLEQKVTGMNVTLAPTTVSAGDTANITVSLVGTLTGSNNGKIKVAPDAARYETTVTRADPDDATKTIGVNSPATRVDEYGVLHVSSRLKSGDNIRVDVTSTYTNPSGDTTTYTKAVTATVA